MVIQIKSGQSRNTVQVFLVVSLGLFFLGGSFALESGEAKDSQPLRGNASFTQEGVEKQPQIAGVPAYYPRGSAILQADRYAEQYKLKAAENIYRRILAQNPKSAAAWNGLGKIAFYKTTSSNQSLRDETQALNTEATQHFMTALRYQPGYVEAQVNLARLLMAQGRTTEAQDLLKRAMQAAPRDYRVLAGQGEWLVRQAQYEEAIPILKQSIQRHSAGETAHYFLGVAYAAQNQINLALEQFQSAIWLNPDNAPARYQMGVIYENQGNGAAAVEAYQKALALKPELTEARQQLAQYLEKHGDTPAALFHWKRLLESSPPDWALTKHVANLSIRNQQPDVAVALYRSWMDKHPDHAQQANAGLSTAKMELARLKLRDSDLVSQGEGKRYAEQAIRYQPDNFEARMLNAKLDRDMGGPKSPIAGQEPGMVDVALRQTSQQPHQSFEQGRLWLARYQFAKAETAFRESRRVGEGNRNDMVFGELFLTMSLPELAQECFQKVLKSKPDNASAKLGAYKASQAQRRSQELYTEAMALNGKENGAVIINKLEAALAENIKNAPAHYRLAQLYEKTKQYAPAADHYFAYLNLDPAGDWANNARSRIGHLTEKLTPPARATR